ncbi:amino acid ABC transporter permease [Kineococcus sp. SYSU DK003]|uniref:amino acid ABC transporter permease n=1 Tax=Kineococcus sp. SYSU DK003 TaxID=3383124 RepID=UPI003D7CE827
MTAPTAVLFDEPGPVARRRTRTGSIVAGVLLLATLVLILIRMQQQGQLDPEKWGPLIDPTNADFAAVWQLLGPALGVTLRAAAVAIVASIVLGLVIGALRLLLPRAGRVPLIGIVELLRGLPVVVTILYVDVLLRTLGVHPGSFWVLVVGLTLYNCVIISEIVRAGVQSLPRGQVEAGLAIGMTPAQVMGQIQLPQAVRAMLPALISQMIVVLKDTALGSVVLVSLGDLGEIANRLRQVLDNSVQTYLVVGLIFVVINLLLDLLARWVQRRLSGSGRSTAKVEVDNGMQMTGGSNT